MPVRIEQQRQPDHRTDPGSEAQKGYADDAPHVGGIQPCGLIDAVADRTADHDVKADGVGDRIGHRARKGCEPDGHPVGRDASRGQNVIEPKGAEAQHREP